MWFTDIKQPIIQLKKKIKKNYGMQAHSVLHTKRFSLDFRGCVVKVLKLLCLLSFTQMLSMCSLLDCRDETTSVCWCSCCMWCVVSYVFIIVKHFPRSSLIAHKQQLIWKENWLLQQSAFDLCFSSPSFFLLRCRYWSCSALIISGSDPSQMEL